MFSLLGRMCCSRLHDRCGTPVPGSFYLAIDVPKILTPVHLVLSFILQCISFHLIEEILLLNKTSHV